MAQNLFFISRRVQFQRFQNVFHPARTSAQVMNFVDGWVPGEILETLAQLLQSTA